MNSHPTHLAALVKRPPAHSTSSRNQRDNLRDGDETAGALTRRRYGLPWVAAALLAAVLASAADTPPQINEVIVVFKTHFDIGYTDMASNIVQKYRTTMIDNALAVVDAGRAEKDLPQFAWTIPGWPLNKIMEDWPGQTVERRTRLQRAFREGRFVVHALPFTAHTELLETEDLVRGFGYASSQSRDAGLSLPRDAKMTDVPCHSWVLPTLLRHAGVDFLHLGCNPASRSPQVPILYWWEGPDRSRVLTMYSAGSYGSDLRPPAGWPYKTWLALIHTGDNHGPPTPAEVKELFVRAAKDLPGVKVRVGRLSDFSDAIAKESATIPVVRGDMPDTWIHGPLCDPQGASLARRTRPLLATTESLNTELGIWGLAPMKLTQTLREAREQSLLYGEHTWGGALSWAYEYSQKTPFAYGAAWKALREAGRFARLEASWEEHSSYIRKAAALVTPALQSNLDTLASSVKVDGPRVVVFNPLPWPRSGEVRFKTATFDAAGMKAIDGGPVANIIHDGPETVFVALDVPPMGYRTYVPADGLGDSVTVLGSDATCTIENEFLRITVEPERGGISRVVDRKSGRDLVDAGSPYRFGQFLYERFDADQVAAYVKAYVKIDADWAVTELGKPNLPPSREVPHRAVSPTRSTAEVRRTPLSTTVVLSSPATDALPFAITTRIILPNAQPWLEIEVEVHDKPADPWPEAGWICLPVRVENPTFSIGRQAGITDPARDIVPGANRDLFAVNSGVTLRDRKGWGMGFCPLDHAVVSLGRPGCWRYSPEDFTRDPVAFVNVFNNQWTTNFRLWNSGTVRSRVRVWPTRSGMSVEQALVTPSAEARNPLQAAASQVGGGTLPASQEGLKLSHKGVLVTAFGPNPDGAGLVLRLWEQTGGRLNCTVTLPKGCSATTAQPVDLRGTPIGKPLPVRSGTFRVALNAFAPSSFVLTP